jgi:heptaprenyl diphosphate synthase
MTFLLYKAGWKDTVIVSMIRIVLISMLFGNIQTLTFSVAGAIVSLLGMILLKKIDRFSCVAVSVTGGVLHNVGQIIAACLWTQTAQIAFYLPMLLFSGTVAGAVIGLLAGLMLKRFEKWKL